MTKQAIPLRPQVPNAAQRIYNAAWALFCAAVAADSGRMPDKTAVDICRELFPSDSCALEIVNRATAASGTTTVTGWASELTQTATADFLGSLAATSAAAGLMQRGLFIPLADAATVIPGRAADPTAASGVAEGEVIPTRVMTVAPVAISPRKVAAIVALSHELARRAAGQAVLETMLREDAGASLDSIYFSASPGSASVHEGLLHGLTAGQAGDAITVMGELAATVSTSGSGEVLFVTSPGQAAAAPIRAPTLRATILPSLAVPDGRIIAVDPLSLVHAFGPGPEIDASATATLHMSVPALPIVSGATTADPVRSLWQTASIGVRMLLDIGFAKRRAGAVAYADGVQW